MDLQADPSKGCQQEYPMSSSLLTASERIHIHRATRKAKSTSRWFKPKNPEILFELHLNPLSLLAL